MNVDANIADFNYMEEPVITKYDLNYSLESVSIDGDGRIMQVRKGDSVSYNYDFYLRDHLGSTRMVLNDENTVTEKIMYQPYGSIVPLDSAAPSLPAREKFTGKEYDVQGADFARVEYDIQVYNYDSIKFGSNPLLKITYRDIGSGLSYTKTSSFRHHYERIRYSGSESFISDIKIEKIQIYSRGSTHLLENVAMVDSFIIRPGKTRKITLNGTVNLLNTYNDSSFYSITAPVDNTTYFSGTKLFYFGARYYDPELGVWLSVDPAEQFANAYGYANNPLIMVDPDGNFALTAAIVSAIIGSVIGTVQGAINAHNQNGNFWDYFREISLWSNVQGAIGFVSGGLGGGVSSNIMSGVKGIGGAVLAGAASGAIGGAISYTGNYAAQYAYGGFDKNYLDAGEFFGGLGKSTLIGGGVGAAAGGLTYTAKWAWNNTKGSWKTDFAQSARDGFPQYDGNRPGVDYESSLKKDFANYRSKTPYGSDKGESVGVYKIKSKFLTGGKYVEMLDGAHYEGTQNRFIYRGLSAPDIHIHSHPNSAYPSNLDGFTANKLSDMRFYLYGNDRNLYQYNSANYWRIDF